MSTNEESEDENSILLFIIISLTDDRGQAKFCQNLIANLFEKRISSSCRAEFPEVKTKRQIVDHYLKGICTPSQQYGIYTIELQSPSTFYGKYLLQTDDVDIDLPFPDCRDRKTKARLSRPRRIRRDPAAQETA